MAALTESEMRKIARLKREEGLPRLSAHFSWLELSGDAMQVLAHQQFVYDTAMFAATRGVPWPGVISVARMAKGLFPELKDLDLPRFQSLLRDRLSECSPPPSSAHQAALFHFLSETGLAKKRLFRQVLGGARNLSVIQAHLEVQVAAEPRPLAQGDDMCSWERQLARAQLTVLEKQKEAELRRHREGSEVTLEELDIPQGRVDKETVLASVRGSVRATGNKLLARLLTETRLVDDLLELKLQHATLASGGRPHTGPSSAAGLTRCPHTHSQA